MLTKNSLKQLYPDAPSDHIINFSEKHEDLFEKYNIKSWQISMFLAQIGHESAGLSRTVENLNYSASALMRFWGRRFSSYSHAKSVARNQEKIANIVYANRMGNGPPESGDGWKYRGGGYIQLTGKDAYNNVGNIIGVDLVSDPKLTTDPEYALEVVCGVWVWKKLNNINNFITITKRINGGLNGLSDRKRWLYKAKRIINNPVSDSNILINKQLIYRIQRELLNRGYKEVEFADGIIGKKTRSGIKRFKTENGLVSNNSIDKELLSALTLDF